MRVVVVVVNHLTLSLRTSLDCICSKTSLHPARFPQILDDNYRNTCTWPEKNEKREKKIIINEAKAKGVNAETDDVDADRLSIFSGQARVGENINNKNKTENNNKKKNEPGARSFRLVPFVVASLIIFSEAIPRDRLKLLVSFKK